LLEIVAIDRVSELLGITTIMTTPYNRPH